MVVMGKCRLWESAEYGCDGKTQIIRKCRICYRWDSTDYGKVQNMAMMGKLRLSESAEYVTDGKAQIMGKCRIW